MGASLKHVLTWHDTTPIGENTVFETIIFLMIDVIHTGFMLVFECSLLQCTRSLIDNIARFFGENSPSWALVR